MACFELEPAWQGFGNYSSTPKSRIKTTWEIHRFGWKSGKNRQFHSSFTVCFGVYVNLKLKGNLRLQSSSETKAKSWILVSYLPFCLQGLSSCVLRLSSLETFLMCPLGAACSDKRGNHSLSRLGLLRASLIASLVLLLDPLAWQWRHILFPLHSNASDTFSHLSSS